MKNKHKYIIFAGIVVLFLFAGTIFLQQTSDNKNKGKEIIEELSSGITTVSSSITPNTKIWFKDKDVFKYAEIDYGGESYSGGIKNYTFFVSLERINKKDVYVINATYGDEATPKYYIDKNTYKCIKVVGVSLSRYQGDMEINEEDISQIVGNMISGTGMLFYGYWMLGLNESFKIKEEIHGKFSGRDGTSITTYEVLGKEKINGRETYKVKIVVKNKIDRQEMKKEGVAWIDEEKRILTKFIEYSGNLPVKEINIVS